MRHKMRLIKMLIAHMIVVLEQFEQDELYSLDEQLTESLVGARSSLEVLLEDIEQYEQ